MQDQPEHFKGKDSMHHVVEKQTTGLIVSNEPHGIEPSGCLTALTDAAKETAVILLLASAVILALSMDISHLALTLTLFLLGWAIWKGGRAAWLGWSRLEKLHRILAQEKWEIEHNREQEREELSILYQAKGFEGKLLQDVLDVLMADGERLLHVMVEEELNLSLESQIHPLIQGLGAFFGVLCAAVTALAGLLVLGMPGILAMSFLIIFTASYFAAKSQDSEIIAAVIWNLGIAVLSSGMVYFLLEFAKPYLLN